MHKGMEYLLMQVQKPARYTGGELGCVYKPLDDVTLRSCFCFPDTYEIGMSHLGLQILYGVANQLEGVWCERAFAPWSDMEEALRTHGMPLTALESGAPLSNFHVLAFTLQYELCYTNVLNMLDLGGVPLRCADRGEDAPLVVAGGPCAYNPEPMADFIDVFAVGEGETLFAQLLTLIQQGRAQGLSRQALLRELSALPGVYVPALYTVATDKQGGFLSITPAEGTPPVITKRIEEHLDDLFYPTNPLVPNTEVVHDRVMLELFRGCIRGCRFCQAGFSARPVRARNPETLVKQGMASLAFSGCEEISLTSLSSSDYRALPVLTDQLLEYCEPRRISLSLPSLRADSFSRELLEKVQKVRKSGLTFAPEAGTARLRDVINKNLTEEDLLKACTLAFEGGWNNIKLYFMIGLPTETDEDILGIAKLAEKVYFTWRQVTPDRSRGVRITVSASCFVPKPLTPFQWAAQDSMAEFKRKQALLKHSLRKQINFHWHGAEGSVLEGVFARGDRRLGQAIELAWRDGCRMDAWKEHFSFTAWQTAIEASGLTFEEYNGARNTDTPLPWEHISAGVDRGFLLAEYERGLQADATPDCRQLCSDCGASALLESGVCDA